MEKINMLCAQKSHNNREHWKGKGREGKRKGKEKEKGRKGP